MMDNSNNQSTKFNISTSRLLDSYRSNTTEWLKKSVLTKYNLKISYDKISYQEGDLSTMIVYILVNIPSTLLICFVHDVLT